MLNTPKFIGFLFLSLFLFHPQLEAQKDWTEVINKDGIKVWNRQPSGYSMKESRATTVVNAKMDKVIAILMDFENFKNWMHRTEESKTLKKVKEGVFYNYYKASAPWPVSARDVILYSWVETGADGTWWSKFYADPDYIPENKGIIRMPEFKGHWKVVPLGDDKVEVTYQMLSDPGGSIPTWLSNSVAKETPYLSLKSLKKNLAGS